MSQKCVTSLLTRLEQNLPPNICIACLQAFRIFSREKTHMESLTSERSLRLLMRIAGIEYYTTEHGENVTIQNGNQDGKKQLIPPPHPRNEVGWGWGVGGGEVYWNLCAHVSLSGHLSVCLLFLFFGLDNVLWTLLWCNPLRMTGLKAPTN